MINARIIEAEEQQWRGEAEGLKVSLDAARLKFAQMDGIAARHRTVVQLGASRFADTAGRTVTTADHATPVLTTPPPSAAGDHDACRRHR